MDDQCATYCYPLGPAVEIRLRHFLTVAAVDEEHLKRCPPSAGDHGRLPDYRHNRVVEAGGIQGATERRERVEASADRVHHGGVVELPPGLMFLGSMMVVDGVEHAVALSRGCTEQNGGSAAVGTDLDRYPTG